MNDFICLEVSQSQRTFTRILCVYRCYYLLKQVVIQKHYNILIYDRAHNYRDLGVLLLTYQETNLVISNLCIEGAIAVSESEWIAV